MMPQTQIAFDFGDLPQNPLPENILVSEKEDAFKKEPAIQNYVEGLRVKGK